METSVEIIFCVINTGTGVISRTGVCTENEFDLQAGPGEQTLVAPQGVTDVTHYWNGEAFIEYPPCPGNTFVWTGTEWADPRTEQEILDQEQEELTRAKAQAIVLVNDYSGEVRRKFVTDIPGQEALYLLKEREARDWLSAEGPNLTDYPLIAAEVGITGETPDQVAQVYLNLGAIFLQAAAALEQVRLSKIAAIEAAQTSEDIEAVISDFPALIESFTSPLSNE